MRNAVVSIEDRRFYHARRDRPGRHGARGRRQHLDGHARPGRLDDHPAARQEPLAPGAGRHALAAAQDHRGRARLPGRAALVEAEDPRGVPQHDLLRPPGLRRRGRRRGLLRRAREGPAAAAGRPARRHWCRTRPPTTRCCTREARWSGGTLVLGKLLEQGYIDAFEYRLADSKPLLPRGPADRLPAREEDDRELLRRLRAPAADQPLRAARRRSAAACASTRRSTRACSGWRSRPCARRCRSAGPRPRWSRSTRPPARSRRWSAAATTRTRSTASSTSPPTPCASRARRSRSSCCWRRSRRASSRRRSSTPTSSRSSCRAARSGRCRTTRAPTAASIPLTTATTFSDNTVFAQLALRIGTERIRRVAHLMGIARPIGADPAIALGGLRHCCTPIEMALAYSTLANEGVRVTGSLPVRRPGPGRGARPDADADRDPPRRGRQRQGDRPQQAAEGAASSRSESALTAIAMLRSVIRIGTAHMISNFPRPAAGKTGTTEDFVDAWFVGMTPTLTTAVWNGFPTIRVPMLTQFHGGPVFGGTYPGAALEGVHAGRRSRARRCTTGPRRPRWPAPRCASTRRPASWPGPTARARARS